MQQGSFKRVMDSLREEYIGPDREVDLALLSGSPLVRYGTASSGTEVLDSNSSSNKLFPS